MKCPKCGIDLDENARTCPSCNFSITVDGNPVQLPIIDEPIIPGTFAPKATESTPNPENTMTMEEQVNAEETPVLSEDKPEPIVSAPAETTPVREEAKEEVPVEVAQESPVEPEVTASALESPTLAAVPADPEVTAPAPVTGPETPAPEVTTSEPPSEVAPASPAPTPVAENQSVQTVTQMPASAVALPSEPAATAIAAPKKKNPILFIVIGALGLVVCVLSFFLIKTIDSNNKLEPKVNNTGLNQPVQTPDGGEENVEDSPPTELADEISLYGIKFKLPEGFEYIYENQYYQVYNTELRKLFILDDLYTGNASELEEGINLMKTEYPSSGCTNVTTSIDDANGIKYGFVSYVANNQKFEEIYTLINDKYILAFYNIQTSIVSTQDFIDYTTSIAKTADDSSANFSSGDTKNKLDIKLKKDIINIKEKEDL